LTRARVLVIDDKPTFLSLFQKLIGDRMDVRVAASGAKALGLLALESFDVVVTDVRMPGMDGLAVLREVKQRAHDVEVILVTGYGTIPQAVQAMQDGAFSYLTKPFDPDEALQLIESAVARKRAADRAAGAARPAEGQGGMDYRSGAMRRVLEVVRGAAATDLPILLLGEVGTGKRTVARMIHGGSTRSHESFLTLDATSIARGFEATAGTVYVSEVEQLGAVQQAEWLRLIDQRPGPRWIASTHEPLETAVAEGTFDPRLHARLNAFPICMPALRDRQEDIPVLAASFVERSVAGSRAAPALTSEALAALVAYDWPGNVRELQATIQRLVEFASGGFIGVDALPEEVRGHPNLRVDPAMLVELTYREVIDLARDRATRDYLIELLRAARGNVTRAAQRAAVERESFHRLMRRFHLRADDFRDKG